MKQNTQEVIDNIISNEKIPPPHGLHSGRVITSNDNNDMIIYTAMLEKSKHTIWRINDKTYNKLQQNINQRHELVEFVSIIFDFKQEKKKINKTTELIM